RLGLSVRDVEDRSRLLCVQRCSRRYNLSKAWIADVENGRFLPGSTKMASLCAIYGVEIGELQALYGIDPTDIRNERPIYGPPKAYLVSTHEVSADSAAPAPDPSKQPVIAETNLLTRLIDRWGDLPVPLLRKLGLKKSVYGFIGTEDFTMSPLLPP